LARRLLAIWKSIEVVQSMPQERVPRASEMREKQRTKIRELRTALLAAGFVRLNPQSDALGLGRSTTWALLNASHKGSGISAHLINRMMASPKIPFEVHLILRAYVDEKVAGLYGHTPKQLERFRRSLAPQSLHTAVKRSAAVRTAR
jgi:hypothetical protein